jgi:hypothetical protein
MSQHLFQRSTGEWIIEVRMEGERVLFVEHRKSTEAGCVSKNRYDCPRLLNDETLELNTPLPSTSSGMDALLKCCLENSGISGACRESDVNQQQETFPGGL